MKPTLKFFIAGFVTAFIFFLLLIALIEKKREIPYNASRQLELYEQIVQIDNQLLQLDGAAISDCGNALKAALDQDFTLFDSLFQQLEKRISQKTELIDHRQELYSEIKSFK